MSEQTANLGLLVRHGAPTDQDVMDEAFRLWIEQGRSWTAVARLSGIEVRTLHNWGHAEHWEQRRADQSAAFMPGKKVETAIALRLAAHNAAVKLQQLSNDYLERDIEPNPKLVDALTKIVAAGGYSSIGSRDPLSSIDTMRGTTRALEATDLRGKSPQELREIEDQHRGKAREDSSKDGRRQHR